MTVLAGIYELRKADAHLLSAEYEEAFAMVGVEPEQPYVMQGRDLIHACASSLWAICDAIERKW